MTIYYIDPSAGTNGNGLTPATPANTFVGLTQAAGNSFRFKRGTTYSGAFTTTAAGTAGSKIVFEAYSNSNGSDNPSLPRPIINVTATVGTYNSSNKNFVEYWNIDWRGPAIAVASDANLIFLGNNGVVSGCKITTNVGAIGSYGKSNVVISGNEIDAVSHAAGSNNNVLSMADPTVADNIQILNNRIIHRGGATGTSVIRLATSNASMSITNVLIEGNVISPPDGVEFSPNFQNYGIRINDCPGIIIRRNNVRGFLSGVFLTGNSTVNGFGTIEENIFCHNLNFGIHLGSFTRGSLIQRNDCSYNGTSLSSVSPLMQSYGRGIEISAGAAQSSSGGHTIRFNKLHYNVNWGGSTDNGSEGCGLGLDDGTDSCTIYGNSICYNEGNGIQFYGATGLSQTGGHIVSGNYLVSNCTASFNNRKTGGVAPNAFNAHISFANTFGNNTLVSGNIMTGSTTVGISENSGSANITKANNIFLGVPYPLTGPAVVDCHNNVYRNEVQRYSTTTTNANGSQNFIPSAFVGVSDLSFDPVLDSRAKPRAGSPCIGAGKPFPLVTLYDFTGRPFNKIGPAIGAFEDFQAALPWNSLG